MMTLHSITHDHFSNLQYRKAGTGRAIVLLHGFPEDGSSWQNIVPVLANSFTVITPDLPGSGGSDLPKGDVGMEMLAESIDAILQTEGITEAVIVGHSMGGYIALAFAEAFGKKVQGLALVHSSAMDDSEEKKQLRKKSIELVNKGGREPFIKGMIPNLFAKDFTEKRSDIINRQIERGMKLSQMSIVGFYNAMINRPDRRKVLHSADFPVEWIIGTEDSVIPLKASLQQTTLADVNFVSLYPCGHMSMIEMPEKLANDLMEFGVYCYNC